MPTPKPVAFLLGLWATSLFAQPADLRLDKDDGGVEVPAGGSVVYTLEVENLGPGDAHDVEITEIVPDNTRFDAAASSTGWQCFPDGGAGNLCHLALGDLEPGFVGVSSFGVRLDLVDSTLITNTATVDGSTEDPDPANNADVEITPVLGPGNFPNLGVVKDPDADATGAGATIAYTLSYRNQGNQGAAGVEITEVVPENTTFRPAASTAGWSCSPNNTVGSLCTLFIGGLAGGGASGSAIFAVTVDDPLGPGVGEIHNRVEIADDGTNGPDQNPLDNVDDTTTPIDSSTTAPDLTLAKSDGGATTDAGDSVAYTLTYANVGNQGAAGVTLVDTVPDFTTFDPATSSPGWSCSPDASAGSLCSLDLGIVPGGGASGSAIFGVRVDPVVPAGVDEIFNLATILDDTSSGPDLDPTNNQASDTTPLGSKSTAPDYLIAKDDGGVEIDLGDTVVYTLTYANAGNQGGSGVVISETVPDVSTFAAADSTPGWTCLPDNGPGSLCTFDLGDLAGGGDGGSVAFAVTLDSVLPAGVSFLTNTAFITDDGQNGADANPLNNTATDTTPITTNGGGAPDLRLEKRDGGVVADPGDTVVYTLVTSNLGNRGATGTVLTETVPEHTTFDAAASDAGWSCQASTAGSVCTFELATVEVGDLAEVRFAVTLDATIPAGVDQIVNTASVADDGLNGTDPDPSNNTATEITALGRSVVPDLFITIDDADVTADAGDTVLYTLDFGNRGNQGASGARLTVLLPPHVAFDGAASDAGWTCPATQCTFDAGTLMGGDTGFSILAIEVDAPLAAGVEELLLTASITDDGTNGPDLDPDDNTDDETTPIGTGDGGGTAPDLTITKDDGSVVASAGSLLTYILDWSNQGNQGATGVEIIEQVPRHTTFEAASSSPGWACDPPHRPGILDPPRLCRLSIQDLEGGATGSAFFSVRVDDRLPADLDAISNWVTIVDDRQNGLDPNPENNIATLDTPVEQTAIAPDLALQITDGGVSVPSGGTILYQLSYRNHGGDATGVVIHDDLPPYTEIDPAQSSPGWRCILDGEDTLCSLPIGAVPNGTGGTVVLAATVANPVPAAVLTVTTAASIGDDGMNGPDQWPDDNFAFEETTISTPGGKRREGSWWVRLVWWLVDLFLWPIEAGLGLISGWVGVEEPTQTIGE